MSEPKLMDKASELTKDLRRSARETAEMLREKSAGPRRRAKIKLRGVEHDARKLVVKLAETIEKASHKVKEDQEAKRRSALGKKAAASRNLD